MKRKSRQDRDLPEGVLNVIPIVDVSFCLVIFCLVTMNIFLTSGIKVLHSQTGAAKGRATLNDNISIQLTGESKIFVDGKEVSSYDLMKELLKKLPQTKDQMVIITADESNTCEQIVDILDTSKKSGAKRLALLQKPDEEDMKKEVQGSEF